jgi:GNAT superfamily N-acetyltransferase
MPYAPAAHSDDEIRSWVKTLLLPTHDTVVAEANRQLSGVMVTTRESECSWIKQMAVDPNFVGRGIGSTLIGYAFRVLPSPIRLYAFQANAGARRFYERHGFRAIQFTDGRANEERCPDVLYEFSSSGTASAQTTVGSNLFGITDDRVAKK